MGGWGDGGMGGMGGMGGWGDREGGGNLLALFFFLLRAPFSNRSIDPK